MKFTASTILLLGLLAACSEELPTNIPTLAVQGSLIDGSDDLREAVANAPAVTNPALEEGSQEVEVEELATTEPSAAVGESGEPQVTDSAEDSSVDAKPEEAAVPVAALTEDEPAPGNESGAASEGVEEETVTPETSEPEGLIQVTYQDLSLVDYDVDAMLDYMLFPDEYEDEETADLEFPADLKRLDGREVSIVGYMIPGEIDRGNVRDFMLVRDLMGCCFGGAPMPDEWVDVIMEEDAKAEYRPYMPMRVTGIMTLGGEQDEAGFALGIYRMKATEVQLED